MPCQDLKAEHRDFRVLEIMCLLRTLHAEFYPEEPLHVVGENCINTTALLAIAPTGAQTLLPDFINTQAIYARVLAQTLAYPKMAPCLAQLFYPVSGNPQLTLCPVGFDLIPCGRATFAQIVQTVQSALPGDIVLGWVSIDGGNVFAPRPEVEHDFVEGDKVILLTRRQLATTDDSATARDPQDSAQKDLSAARRVSGESDSPESLRGEDPKVRFIEEQAHVDAGQHALFKAESSTAPSSEAVSTSGSSSPQAIPSTSSRFRKDSVRSTGEALDLSACFLCGVARAADGSLASAASA
jgi:hypothetical protein